MLKLLLLSCFLVAAFGARIPSEGEEQQSLVPQLDGRIVGGREVSISRHPHQVSLRRKGCDACAFAHTCGGSIFNERVIITAAHCVNARIASNFMVVAGTDERNGNNGAISPVDKIVMHELYNSSITDNDVAILFLGSPLPLNGVTMAPIALASVQPANGAKSLITGWGAVTEGGASSNKLLEVEVPIISNELCNEAYEGLITDSMLCAGAVGGGKDACQGDSGGPLLVNWVLAGIVSWGFGCARPTHPGVYASVPHLKGWIEETIAANL